MNDSDLSDAIDGLYAYDGGATDSGIHDLRLRKRVHDEIKSMPLKYESQIYPDRLTKILRDLYLSDEAIAKGYGIEDFFEVVKWVDELIDCN